MAADYRKFKTPFYEIEVSDPNFKRKVHLPHHILRLVQRIEITEAFASTENEYGSDLLRISFLEGSREPGSEDPKAGTAGLYHMSSDGKNTDLNIAGSITNRAGSILDLRFSGTGGITFLSSAEKRTAKVDNTLQKNVDGKVVTRKHKNEPSTPRFLFESMNKIRITWGYKEDHTTVRSKVFNIISLESIFSDNGPNIINLMCSDAAPGANQLTPTSAITFGTVQKFKGDYFVDFKDLKTDEMIRKIVNDAGMAAIISTDLPSDTLDKSKQKMWIAGESFHEFMTKLAKTHNAYYKLVHDPHTAKLTLIFIKKEDFEARPVIADKELLTYKFPGTLIKSININAEFYSPNGQTTSNIDSSGQPTKVQQEVMTNVVQYKIDKEEVVKGDPTKDPGLKGLVNGVMSGNYTGKLNVHPNESVKYHEGLAQTGADAQARQVAITVNTVGYTKLTPGVMDISGIGVRYSGKYRIVSVEHVIDASSGYTCKMTGMTHSLPNGGTKVQETDPGTPKEKEKQVNLQQFSSVRNKLDKFQGTI